MTRVPPIRREVLVGASVQLAFDVFTSRIGNWWPLDSHGVFHDGTVAFVDGALVETSSAGVRTEWGRVIEWDAPQQISFSWYPGSDSSRASTVTVAFSTTTDGTVVTLRHDGWEVFQDPDKARAEYDSGWPMVLDRYRDAVPVGDTWVTLVHRGTDVHGESVFADPRFGEHVAFLRRRQDAGELIAAGSLPDEPGTGMTVLRLTGPDRLADAITLATEDDGSVRGGLFDVQVRLWNVQLPG